MIPDLLHNLREAQKKNASEASIPPALAGADFWHPPNLT